MCPLIRSPQAGSLSRLPSGPWACPGPALPVASTRRRRSSCRGARHHRRRRLCCRLRRSGFAAKEQQAREPEAEMLPPAAVKTELVYLGNLVGWHGVCINRHRHRSRTRA
ncbi:hypothetical protein ZEAMMB73_Zm00001d002032 [Zea mays]|uniref:Uncharacterized protein n=1 Tax=Zea mays TaxID=4577 RepID=A0A1D6DVU1_MAIZE|nr:hypothetical protein ZEAMMB73_Zm00001d002032 [Zea mays]ONM12832.1 hypothetical protein ZEAMMB73_Zm00001d002032 [Zea mays]ONM12834.1 hypothetical protein ZEAMMB73_Zm00001d002032 [Zea mays]ONM12845.1 hypothetical protein ZEAMMB73_Zm00001d002032 [Zea mays]ONM12853.1 hypothetical protein ZEAMMB73_Zm00001d002032 [Zea mays]